MISTFVLPTRLAANGMGAIRPTRVGIRSASAPALALVWFAAVLVSAEVCAPSQAKASLLTESCNDVPQNTGLYTRCGTGTGWGESSCYSGTHTGPKCDYTDIFYNAPGYSNHGNEPDRGGRLAPNGAGYIHRTLPTPITTVLWVSITADTFPLLSLNDVAIGELYGLHARIAFGLDGTQNDTPRPYAELRQGAVTVGREVGGALDTRGPILLIAKIEININAAQHERISLWANPAVLTEGEAGLGAPAVTLTDVDALPSFAGFFIALANANAIDAVRLSVPGDTPASLAEVLLGTPVGLTAKARTCQRQVANRTERYMSVVHRELARCRDRIQQGTLQLAPSECANTPAAAAGIATAGQRLRAGLEGRCSDIEVAMLSACDDTLDGLVSSNGASGCLVSAAQEAALNLLQAEYGE